MYLNHINILNNLKNIEIIYIFEYLVKYNLQNLTITFFFNCS